MKVKVKVLDRVPVNVLVIHRLRHQLHRGLLNGLHPSSAEGWSLLILNLVSTSLSRRFIGLQYIGNSTSTKSRSISITTIVSHLV